MLARVKGFAREVISEARQVLGYTSRRATIRNLVIQTVFLSAVGWSLTDIYDRLDLEDLRYEAAVTRFKLNEGTIEIILRDLREDETKIDWAHRDIANLLAHKHKPDDSIANMQQEMFFTQQKIDRLSLEIDMLQTSVRKLQLSAY